MKFVVTQHITPLVDLHGLIGHHLSLTATLKEKFSRVGPTDCERFIDPLERKWII